MPHKKIKRLYKSNSNVVFMGAVGGLGEYFAIDPTVLRVGYLLTALFTGVVPGIVVYVALAIIIPSK